MCSDPEDPTPTCDGSAMNETKVGDRIIRGGVIVPAIPTLPSGPIIPTDPAVENPQNPSLLNECRFSTSPFCATSTNPFPYDFSWLNNTPYNYYDFDAIGLGLGGSAGVIPSAFGAGAESLYIFDTAEIAGYYFIGPAGVIGAGGAGGPYLILAFNVDSSLEYTGVSNVITGTVAGGLAGITISYFWGGDEPFTPDVTQGITIGWSPGAEVSISYAQLSYMVIGAINVIK
jgi:hypothetical protein